MLATGNVGKVAEMRSLLGVDPVLRRVILLTPRDWPSPLPEVAETGETFLENALLKAQALAEATGLPALADDSGLCVDALGGAPGVHSARWAGPEATDADRNQKLLTALASTLPADRAARFVAAVVFALPSSETADAEGVCPGLILEAPRGANGFGYDPLFFLPEQGRTLAELSSAEKNAFSHRARAVQQLLPALRSRFAGAV